MNRLTNWISSVLKEAARSALTTFLAGILLTILVFAFSASGLQFLGSQIRVPAMILAILALLAILGVAAVADRILTTAQHMRASRTSLRIIPDPHLEEAARSVLERLTKVQVGISENTDTQVKRFTADLLSHFDQWEAAVTRCLSPSEKARLTAMREEIAGHWLPNSQPLAPSWISTVKEFTAKCRAGD